MKTIVAFLLLGASAFAAEPKIDRDVPYAEPKTERQTLDIYAPAEGKQLPVVFWIHGGGWQTGDKSSVQQKPQAFVDRGFVFVSTNYRLLPKVDMETIFRDVAKSLGWVHKHIAEYGGDPQRIFVMGHSAGAQLAALICIDDRYLKAEGVPFSVLKGCVPVDGDTYDVPAIIETAETRRRVHGQPQAKFGHREKFGNTPEKHRDFSAVTHVAKDKGIPPFLILYVADHPDNSAQAQRLAAVLNEAGISAKAFGAQETNHNRLNEKLGVPDDPATKALFEFVSELTRPDNAARSAPRTKQDTGRTIVGVVRDAETGSPISDIVVFINGTGYPTDSHGRYRRVRRGEDSSTQVWILADRSPVSYVNAARIFNEDNRSNEIIGDFDLPRAVVVTGRVIESGTDRAIVSAPRRLCHDPESGGPLLAGYVHYFPLSTNAALRDTPTGSYFEGLSKYAAQYVSAEIDGDGRFRIAVPPGPGVVLVRAERGHHMFPFQLTPGWKESAEYHRLFPYATLATRAKDDGAPDGDAQNLPGFAGQIPLATYHAYRVIDPPAEASTLDLTLTVSRAELPSEPHRQSK